MNSGLHHDLTIEVIEWFWANGGQDILSGARKNVNSHRRGDLYRKLHLKGSKIKSIKVKVGSKQVNKQFAKTYKKIFKKGNSGKKVSVK